MQRTRLYLLPAAVVIGLLLLGYTWPQAAILSDPLAERDWQWPSVQTQKETEPQPKLLARFWPVQLNSPTKMNNEEADAVAKADLLAQQTMKLVAIVRQGAEQQALVLTPAGKLNTLSVGDLLDKQRRVTAISNTSLSWQRVNEDDSQQQDAKTASPQQGELTLFPRPPALFEPTAIDEKALSGLTALNEETAISDADSVIDTVAINDKNADHQMAAVNQSNVGNPQKALSTQKNNATVAVSLTAATPTNVIQE
ncbi:MAG: hypothetical protein WBH20_11545 [Oceanisphaera sp.]|uniref:hypothetical protein n=1 Tax=Oceanisphaera sp. TaxID=1929979 RepID=UPI003C76DB4E